MKVFLVSAMGCRAGILIAVLAAGAAAEQPIHVTIYHTNDIHGWIMPRPDKVEPSRQIGGAAALAALIARETGPKLVLDAGDWWQGTPEGSVGKGQALAEVFNAIGYDALVVGNHEYDAGRNELKTLIGKIHAPVLSANTYDDDGKRVHWVKPWIIKDVAGVKFGIFGLTTSTMRRMAYPKHISGLTFRREVDEAREAVEALKKAGATVIIAVVHVDFEQQNPPPIEGVQSIARQVPGIDLIISGHTHAVVARSVRDATNGTLISQAGAYLTKVGRVAIDIDPTTKKVVTSTAEFVDLWLDRVGEAPAVRNIVAKQIQTTNRVYEKVIATAATSLEQKRGEESAIGDWITDCYREHTGAQAAFMNGGGIRANIVTGPVTVRSIFNVMPFDSSLVILAMKGVDVRAVLDYGLALTHIPQVSGFVVDYSSNKPSGQRIALAAIGDAALDDARTYKIATIDFMASGGDGYSMFERFLSSEATGVIAREALIDCAVHQKKIVSPPIGRLKRRKD